MAITTIIADDHTIIREGLKAFLTGQGFEVAAMARNGLQAVELCREHLPDVVIMDISMPGLNGVDATAMIRQRFPEVRIIALSMHSDKKNIDAMFSAGASAYILKVSAIDELYKAIGEVLQGRFYLSSALARMYAAEKAFSDPDTVPRFRQITPKERQVLQLVAEGLKTRQIARIMDRSCKTVESHRMNIMKKLGIFSIAGLTKFAIKEGMVDLE